MIARVGLSAGGGGPGPSFAPAGGAAQRGFFFRVACDTTLLRKLQDHVHVRVGVSGVSFLGIRRRSVVVAAGLAAVVWTDWFLFKRVEHALTE